MVRAQIAGRGIADRRVLAAMEKVPREASCPKPCRSSPTRTRRCRLATAKPSRSPISWPAWPRLPRWSGRSRAQIGAGSGYAAAVLGELRVVSSPHAIATWPTSPARVSVGSATALRGAHGRRHGGLAQRAPFDPSSPPQAAPAYPRPGAPSSPSSAGWLCWSAARRRISTDSPDAHRPETCTRKRSRTSASCP